MPGKSFTCPRCGSVSWNPNDLREGYCGLCHDWTRDRPLDGFGEYLTAEGADTEDIIRRLENLKFETIVTGRTYQQVIDDWTEEEGS